MTGAKAVFLDRDGVINRDLGYVHRIADFEFLPGAPEAMRRFMDAGYQLVVVTNQSGIARGYFSETQYQALTSHMRASLEGYGVTVAGVYHCPHHPEALRPEFRLRCDCRKPQAGMILQAASDLDIDLGRSILVGDKVSDIEAGRRAGVRSCYLIGHLAADTELARSFPSLADCAEWVTGDARVPD